MFRKKANFFLRALLEEFTEKDNKICSENIHFSIKVLKRYWILPSYFISFILSLLSQAWSKGVQLSSVCNLIFICIQFNFQFFFFTKNFRYTSHIYIFLYRCNFWLYECGLRCSIVRFLAVSWRLVNLYDWNYLPEKWRGSVF